MHIVFGLLAETVEKQRGGDRTGKAAARHMVDIGDFGLQHPAVTVPQRQPPDRIMHRTSGLHDLFGQSIVLGVKRRQIGTECNAGRAGQRGILQDQFRLVLIGQCECIGQDQAAFGIGIADFDTQTLAACQHVTGPEGRTRNGIFHRRNQHAQPHGQIGRHDHRRGSQRGGRTAHVLFHQQHRRIGFDVEATGIKGHALADQGDFGMVGLSPDQIDQPRCARRGAADGMDHRIIGLQQIIAADHADIGAKLVGQRASGILDLLRAHVIGGRIDQITAHEHGFGHGRDGMSIHTFGHDKLAGRLIGLFVTGEAIGAEREGQHGLFGIGPAAVEPVLSGRQELGQTACCKHSVFIGSLVQPKQHSDDFAFWIGQAEAAAVFAGKALRLGIMFGGGPEPRRSHAPVLALDSDDRNGGAV